MDRITLAARVPTDVGWPSATLLITFSTVKLMLLTD